MPSGLCDRLQRILPFAKKAADAVVTNETEILELIPRIFEVMHRVAEFFHVTMANVVGDRFLLLGQVLTIATRIGGGSGLHRSLPRHPSEHTSRVCH